MSTIRLTSDCPPKTTLAVQIGRAIFDRANKKFQKQLSWEANVETLRGVEPNEPRWKPVSRSVGKHGENDSAFPYAPCHARENDPHMWAMFGTNAGRYSVHFYTYTWRVLDSETSSQIVGYKKEEI